MQIQPMQPVAIKLKCGQIQTSGFLVQLTDSEMQLTCTDYMEKDSSVAFTSKFFSGEAKIIELNFAHSHFLYTLSINFIRYQPGLVVNKTL
ncbi:hypothetical protein [Legionella micdadei]|uniref:Uncharacterized protein n=1 Tax=Legionella micdadei TaxID=451 RepID=A0A098GDF1_LEGMI|nr:hypothetical protein [Legionella micdadei]ARG98793.1 hypothetical protein B6N58_00480 [Legionella micdadei]ARH01511.1 hypothetical protein B6V88_00480 [Legionella micdadei]KTD29105.1 hypothetical protein Lmic_1025 [Legionella micdadei]NSL19392.1 hypothetical protein [Legionella micdadei]CEG59471.1 conserved protein of unknown function [Legionella micdadei]